MSVASRFENASARASHTRTHAGAQQQTDRWKTMHPPRTEWVTEAYK